MVVVWGCALALSILGRPALAAPLAEEPRVALGPVHLQGSFEPHRRAIEANLARGLKTAGLAVADEPSPPETPLCATAACWAELAHRHESDLVVQADVTGVGRAYRLTLEVWNAAAGQSLAREELVCGSTDPCPTVARQVRELARELGRRARKRLNEAPPPVAQLPPTPPLPPATAAPPNLTLQASARPVPPPRRRRLLPWVAMGGGVVLLAVGTSLFFLDGSETDCRQVTSGEVCFRLRDTRPTAYVVGALGAALTGGGLAWLLIGSHAAVALGPTGLRLAGRF